MESSWRCPAQSLLCRADKLGKVFVSRWTLRDSNPVHVFRHVSESHHVVAVNLRFTSVKFIHAGRPLVDGTLVPGAIHVTAPKTEVAAAYRLPCDVLHIFVKQEILAQCYEDLFGKAHSGSIVLDDTNLRRDLTIERLAQSLAGAELWDRSARTIFTDSIGRAIVSRLVEHWFSIPPELPLRTRGLPKWRLRRATDYIDEHLAERIRLREISESASLSPMHFAAQFRLSTGVSPHEYVLRRRVEVAQSLLLHSERNTVDIALSCGFNSQAHFISVFSRYMGDTPGRWRKTSLKNNSSCHGQVSMS
ncbi:AraC family transcriptional regulator [Caballeronia novacaledonica]|uniref:AraC family transcriptional regulator n=1 Tax=Caballeronia novacaledonica TaxID=1544861 RepID=UPI001EE312D3|nr:AraC family transcriptional regulator [Caballeronia novacaledonica]